MVVVVVVVVVVVAAAAAALLLHLLLETSHCCIMGPITSRPTSNQHLFYLASAASKSFVAFIKGVAACHHPSS